MTITNGLCSLADVKTAMRITDNLDDQSLELAVETASRQIEAYCDRRFYAESSASARVYAASSPWLLEIDDIYTTTGLQIATGTVVGTYPTVWQTTDFQLEPLNGMLNAQSWPYTRVRAIASLTFPMNYGQSLVQVTAKWGWSAVPTAVRLAAIRQAQHIFASRDLPLGATAFGETGILRIGREAMHPEARQLLQDYVKDTARVL